MIKCCLYTFMWVLLVTASCKEDENKPLDQCFEPTLSIDVCDVSNTFTLDDLNPYFPLAIGHKVVLEGDDEGELIRVEIRVTDETETVAGVTTRVVEASEYIDDELYEIARDFYAIASDGTVCYFGEDVDFYEDGKVKNHEGTWRAGINGAKPGILIPGSPAVGQSFFQELADEARDQARVTATDKTFPFNGTTYNEVLQMMDSNPLEGEEGCEEEEEKLYAPDIGNVKDAEIELISFTPGS